MPEITFVVPGPPKGKGRPRARVMSGGKFAQMYTPKDTVEYENLVKMAFSQAAPDHTQLDVPVHAHIRAYWPIPKSFSKKKQDKIDSGHLRPVTKPDLDNVAKCILDSLNKIAFRDDSFVQTMTVMKFYHRRPHVLVTLEWEDSHGS